VRIISVFLPFGPKEFLSRVVGRICSAGFDVSDKRKEAAGPG
jgi:hypothetical protein